MKTWSSVLLYLAVGALLMNWWYGPLEWTVVDVALVIVWPFVVFGWTVATILGIIVLILATVVVIAAWDTLKHKFYNIRRGGDW